MKGQYALNDGAKSSRDGSSPKHIADEFPVSLTYGLRQTGMDKLSLFSRHVPCVYPLSLDDTYVEAWQSGHGLYLPSVKYKQRIFGRVTQRKHGFPSLSLLFPEKMSQTKLTKRLESKRELLNPKFEGYKLTPFPEKECLTRAKVPGGKLQINKIGHSNRLGFRDLQARVRFSHLAAGFPKSRTVGTAYYVDHGYNVIQVSFDEVCSNENSCINLFSLTAVEPSS